MTDSIEEQFRNLAARVDSLEQDLVARLQVSQEALRQALEQTEHLLGVLSETRAELRRHWDKEKRDAAEGRG